MKVIIINLALGSIDKSDINLHTQKEEIKSQDIDIIPEEDHENVVNSRRSNPSSRVKISKGNTKEVSGPKSPT